MKIALINENSQAAKNGIIEAALKKVVEPMGHEVVNYGMYAADDAAQLTYVQCGILAAIRAAVVSSGRTAVICARNCHKSVYHAIELNRLTAHWLVPPVDPAFGIYGSITPAMVADALRACPDAAAVILTSPTYEGVLSDLAAIAALCHAANVPLIVDEAHGAHYLPLAAAHGWQGGAIAAGADVIIQSPHKTLPSLTQTALLHWNSSFIPPQELERQLDVFETSSPSYPLMASLDGCTGLLAEHGDAWFAAWRARLQRFSGAVRPLRRLRVLCHGMDDVRRRLIFSGNTPQ